MKIKILIILFLISFNLLHGQDIQSLLNGIWGIKDRAYLYYKIENQSTFTNEERNKFLNNQIVFSNDSLNSYSLALPFSLKNINLIEQKISIESLNSERGNLKDIFLKYGKAFTKVLIKETGFDSLEVYLSKDSTMLIPFDFSVYILQKEKNPKFYGWPKDKEGFNNISYGESGSIKISVNKNQKDLIIEYYPNTTGTTYFKISTYIFAEKTRKIIYHKNTERKVIKVRFKVNELFDRVDISVGDSSNKTSDKWKIKYKFE